MSATDVTIGAATAAPQAVRPRADRFVVSVSLLFAALLGGLIWLEAPTDRLWLFLLGGVLGVALYHGAFGFTAGWRKLVVEKRSGGMRAQLFLLAIASALFIPVLAIAPSQGLSISGTVAPVGTSLLLGSFLFGFGMQLGGGCGSGTLFTVGAGNRRMLVTLLFFIIGSVIGTLHLPWWLAQPGFDPVNLSAVLSPWGALLLQILVLLGLALWAAAHERRHHGEVQKAVFRRAEYGWRSFFMGGWPLFWAALVLAVGNLLTMLIAGYPWGITFAFGLWGAKALVGLGVDMSQFEFWTWDYPALALQDSVLVNVVSVMDFGLLLGAMLAAGLAGKFNAASRNPLPWRSLLGAVVGGLAMGYGARLAFGCNIGAMFSGIASASLHGWIWFGFAFLGSLLGIRARPLFGMSRG
ncbi:YeeE/YedE family protein [Alkalilimnicola sp. S0819]|uniref:YeeE/YedE family protein n=1 Tax=Alkalilimnicola sp. S0819 TaxID=2613922 RepID=UPI00126293E7|nr:YeeE/YedE family protein [Alkalilimnicola sp. S0819]KAB7619638.1 YeeE/YedE family protein [Alkalilimnicola sp. S0819]MPQ17576.1 YeeE/YedE family protein [Alkalilimnicola sp. S0819]